MRRALLQCRVFNACLLFMVGMLVACSARGPDAPYAPPSIATEAPAAPFTPVSPEEWRLDNGLTVLFMPDDELPLVRGTLYLKGGSLNEPPERFGSLEAMGRQMRQGGAGQLSADQLDLELEKLAASIDADYSAEFGTVSFLTLTPDFDRVFSLFKDVVRAPRFEQDRLELWKGQALEAIRRRTDDAGTVAGIAFGELLFGDTRYGRVILDEDIAHIDRRVFRELHDEFVRPDQAILAITGKIDRKRLALAVERAFAGWQPRGRPLPPQATIEFAPRPAIYFVSLPFNQSTVYLGEQGPVRLSPDYIAIEGFNGVFGSGDFGSRLVRRVRTELGLAYSIFGGILAAPIKGRNMIALQTKADTTGVAIRESITALQAMQREPVDDSELSEAKKGIENSYIFKIDTPDDAVRRVALLRLLGYPEDYDRTFIPRIRALSAEDVRAVAERHWHPQHFVIVVVGNENAYNSLQNLMLDPPDVLKNFQIKKVGFKQHLVLP